MKFTYFERQYLYSILVSQIRLQDRRTANSLSPLTLKHSLVF